MCLEVAGLLQVLNQVGDGVGTQGHALDVTRCRPVLHGAQPDCLGTVDGVSDGIKQIRRTHLAGTQLVDHIHAALVVVGLTLAFQILGFNVSQFTVFLLGSRHLRGNALLLLIEAVPVSKIKRSHERQYDQQFEFWGSQPLPSP